MAAGMVVWMTTRPQVSLLSQLGGIPLGLHMRHLLHGTRIVGRHRAVPVAHHKQVSGFIAADCLILRGGLLLGGGRVLPSRQGLNGGQRRPG